MAPPGPAADERYRQVSLWFDSLPGPVVPRAGLPGDLEVDVVVVGAGFTGLWTAWYLAEADPRLRVAVVEAEVAGFGASGRNGGWCSALFALSDDRLAAAYGPTAVTAMRRAMQATVDEVGAAAAAAGIDCHFAKGGTVTLARSPAQLVRARAEVAAARARGVGEDDLRLLEPDEASALVGASEVHGGLYTPHCAALHPARLARGLADAVEARGVRVFEQTAVTALGPRSVSTARGTVRAEVVVRATEGYTPRLAGARRAVAPVYSLMVATEPLDDATWARIGLHRRETVADLRHVVVYGQRTADGRLAFGGRGAPYHYGSSVEPRFDRDAGTHRAVEETLRDLFPALAGVAITHRWGGPLALPRDWHPSVGLDRATGRAWAGGYVGDGVAGSNLAGRTLADLIAGRDSELVALPWVGHRSRRWEPEPLRWLVINAGLRVMEAADREEGRTGRPSVRAAWFERLVGG